MDYALIPLAAILGSFSMVVAVVWLVTSARRRSVEVQAEVQSKMIERFGSSAEFLTFMQTEDGRRLLMGVEKVPQLAARDKIIGSFRKAITTAFLGVAFLAFCIPERTRSDGFIIAGGILLALGAAYTISAFLSMKLSRSWGLMDDNSDTTTGV